MFLGFFTNFNEVPFAVTDFEELHIAPILDRAGEDPTAGKLFLGFLQLVTEDNGRNQRGPVEARALHLVLRTQQDRWVAVAR